MGRVLDQIVSNVEAENRRRRAAGGPEPLPPSTTGRLGQAVRAFGEPILSAPGHALQGATVLVQQGLLGGMLPDFPMPGASGVSMRGAYQTALHSLGLYPELVDPAELPSYQHGQALASGASSILPRSNPEYEQEFFASQLPGVLGSAGTAIGTTLAGGPGLTAATFGLTGTGSAYENARAQNATPDQAARHALAVGAASTAVALPAGKILAIEGKPLFRYINGQLVSKSALSPSIVVEGLKQGAIGGIVSGGLTSTENVSARLNFDPQRSPLEGVFESTAAGGLGFGVIGGGVAALRGRPSAAPQAPAPVDPVKGHPITGVIGETGTRFTELPPSVVRRITDAQDRQAALPYSPMPLEQKISRVGQMAAALNELAARFRSVPPESRARAAAMYQQLRSRYAEAVLQVSEQHMDERGTPFEVPPVIAVPGAEALRGEALRGQPLRGQPQLPGPTRQLPGPTRELPAQPTVGGPTEAPQAPRLALPAPPRQETSAMTEQPLQPLQPAAPQALALSASPTTPESIVQPQGTQPKGQHDVLVAAVKKAEQNALRPTWVQPLGDFVSDRTAVAAARTGKEVPTATRGKWLREHRAIVEQAVKDRQPVPPEVLADYPELAAQTTAPPTAAQTTIAPARTEAAAPLANERVRPAHEGPTARALELFLGRYKPTTDWRQTAADATKFIQRGLTKDSKIEGPSVEKGVAIEKLFVSSAVETIHGKPLAALKDRLFEQSKDPAFVREVFDREFKRRPNDRGTVDGGKIESMGVVPWVAAEAGLLKKSNNSYGWELVNLELPAPQAAAPPARASVPETVQPELPSSHMAAFARTEAAAPKIGDAVRVMGVDSVLADMATHEGVRYELYNDAKLKDNGGAVRVVDVDSGNVVSIKRYEKFDSAEADYRKAVSRASPTAPSEVAVPVREIAKEVIPSEEAETEGQGQGRQGLLEQLPVLAQADIAGAPKSAPDTPRPAITPENQYRIADRESAIAKLREKLEAVRAERDPVKQSQMAGEVREWLEAQPGRSKWLNSPLSDIQEQHTELEVPPLPAQPTADIAELRAINRAKLEPTRVDDTTTILALPGMETEVAAQAKAVVKLTPEKAAQEMARAAAPAKPKPPRLTPPAPLKPSKGIPLQVEAVRDALATEPNRYAIGNSIVTPDGDVVATDGRRMFIIETGKKGGVKPGAYDAKGKYLGPLKKGPKATNYALPDGSTFPAYRDVMPRGYTAKATVDIAKLYAQIKRAIQGTDENSQAVSLYRNPDGTIGVYSRSEAGSAEVGVRDGAELIASFNPDFAMEALGLHSKLGRTHTTLSWGEPTKPVLFTSEGSAGKAIAVQVPIQDGHPDVLRTDGPTDGPGKPPPKGPPPKGPPAAPPEAPEPPRPEPPAPARDAAQARRASIAAAKKDIADRLKAGKSVTLGTLGAKNPWLDPHLYGSLLKMAGDYAALAVIKGREFAHTTLRKFEEFVRREFNVEKHPAIDEATSSPEFRHAIRKAWMEYIKPITESAGLNAAQRAAQKAARVAFYEGQGVGEVAAKIARRLKQLDITGTTHAHFKEAVGWTAGKIAGVRHAGDSLRMMAEAVENMTGDPPSPTLAEALTQAAAHKGRLDVLSLEHLEALEDVVQRFRKARKEFTVLRVGEAVARVNDVADDVVSRVRARKPLDLQPNRKGNPGERGAFKHFFDNQTTIATRAIAAGWEAGSKAWKWLSVDFSDEHGPTNVYAANDERAARKKKFQLGWVEHLKALGMADEVARARHRGTPEKIKLGNREFEWTRGELLNFALQVMSDGANADALGTQGGVVARFRGQPSRRIVLSRDEILDIPKRLTKAELAAAEFIYATFAELHPQSAKVMKSVADKQMGNAGDRYWPMKRDVSGSPKEVGFDNYAQWRKQMFETLDWTKDREVATTPLLVGDALDQFEARVRQTIEFIAFAEPYRAASRLLGHPEVSSTLNAKFGSDWVKIMQEDMRHVVGLRDAPMDVTQRWISRGVSNIMSGIARGALALNPMAAIGGNLPGLLMGISQYKGPNQLVFIRNAARAWAMKTVPPDLLAEMQKHPYLWERTLEKGAHGLVGSPTFSTVEAHWGVFGQRYRKLSDKSTGLINNRDNLTSLAFYMTEKELALRDGLAGDAAIKRALERAAAKIRFSQNPTETISMSHFQLASRGWAIGPALTTLQSGLFKTNDMLLRAIASRDKKLAAQVIALMGLGAVIKEALNYNFRRGVRRLVGADQTPADDSPVKEIAFNTTREAFDHAFPIVGGEVVSLIKSLAQRGQAYPSGIIAPLVVDTYKALQAIGNGRNRLRSLVGVLENIPGAPRVPLWILQQAIPYEKGGQGGGLRSGLRSGLRRAS